MARMIPPVPLDKTPNGERLLFDKLRNDPSAKDWVVFHSLRVMDHEYKEEGEVDFIVVVPSVGILFIEVKGCPVSVVDGVWTYSYIHGDKTSVEGPFRQVSSAMRSLQTYIRKHDNTLSKLLYFSSVFFTHIDFPHKTSEWHQWQSVDRSAIFKDPISVIILSILERAHKHISTSSNARFWYDSIQSRPNVAQVEGLVRLLRPQFECFESKISYSAETLLEINRFTTEQIHVLDCIYENEHLVVSGPAGTGKTVVAVQHFKRLVSQGKKVALLCFNSALGDWLSQVSLSEFDVRDSFIGTFDSLLYSIVGDVKISDGSRIREVLISRFNDFYLSGSIDESFDVLVIDEAQDLLTVDVLEVFNIVLKGGLESGTWMMLGDFERQAIYTLKSSVEEKFAILKNRSKHFSRAALRVNCRNGPEISETLSMVCNLKPAYKAILKSHVASSVDPIFYSSDFDYYDKLFTQVESLLKRYKASEIVILSMKKIESSSIPLIRNETFPARVVPFSTNAQPNTIRFSTVHSFKGLEAPVVLLIDIEGLTSEYHKALLYVGMSRAQVELQIFMHHELLNSYDTLLASGLSSSFGEG